MSIAKTPEPPAVSLRELAARAWARQQAEAAERKRQDIERARENLIADARNALERAFTEPTSYPYREIPRESIIGAEIIVLSGDDLLANRPDCCQIGVTFLGERFEYRGNGAAWGLYHQYTCPACGAVHESTYQINSLSDLGVWVEDAATICPCRQEASDE
mgnify:FL=1